MPHQYVFVTFLIFVLRSCETLVLGQQEVSRQASDLNGYTSPADGKDDLTSEFPASMFFISSFSTKHVVAPFLLR